jgi:hypothetical protein
MPLFMRLCAMTNFLSKKALLPTRESDGANIEGSFQCRRGRAWSLVD